MNTTHPVSNERHELIEQALQHSVGGGIVILLCNLTCHIYSKDVCEFRCGIEL